MSAFAGMVGFGRNAWLWRKRPGTMRCAYIGEYTQRFMRPEAILFDAYGTLLDVHSVVREAAGSLPAMLSVKWRDRQLQYTWLRSLMQRYESFWKVTEDALLAAAEELRIALSPEQVQALMQAYLKPNAFEDARNALERLKGGRMAVLSNGDRAMLEPALKHNRLDAYFEQLISAERVAIYKPSPKVYELGEQALGLRSQQMMFVSSNAWDAAGAKAFGYFVCWVNRGGGPMERLGFEPDRVVSSLEEIASGIGG